MSFHKDVADTIRGVRKDFESRPVVDRVNSSSSASNAVDGAVKEEVLKGLGDLADNYDKIANRPKPTTTAAEAVD